MHILKIILFTASCCGYLFWLVRCVGFSLFKAPFIFCSAISLILCAFGMVGLLNVGSQFLLFTGLGLLAFEGYKLIHSTSWRQFDYWLLSLISIPFITLWFAIDKNFVFTVWDEFSFWASSTKLIHTTNSLFDQNSPIFLKTYPPIQQLFQYYVIRFIGWSERLVLYAQIFWLLAGLLCIAGSLVKDKRYALLFFFLSCSALYYFNYSFSSIYSDALLGVCFAACLALVIDKSCFSSVKQFVCFLACLAALVLIKEVAIVLVATVVLLLLIQLFWPATVFAKEQASVQTLASPNRLSQITIVVLVLLAIGSALLAWSLYVKSIDSARSLDLPTLQMLSQPAWQTRISQTMAEFFVRAVKPGYLITSELVYPLRPSILAVLISLTGLGLLLTLATSAGARLRKFLLVSVLTLGAIGYLCVLLFSYLFIFTEYEGVRLASFERYLSTYLMAWGLIFFASLIDQLTTQPTRFKMGLFIGLVCIILFTTPVTFIKELRSINSIGPAQQLRESIEQFANQAKQHMQSSDKIYFVAQNTNGLERVMFYYAMLPYTSSMSWCWSIGEKYFEGDVWTCNTGLAGLLKGYDYLALYMGDAQFWKRVEPVFQAEAAGMTRGIFKIYRTPNGSIERLEPVH